MTAKIDIITTGYAQMLSPTAQPHAKAGSFMKATGSCCLVRSSGLRVLFDTMGPWERDLLLERLAELKVHQDDIDYLVCSHSHPDHIGNINLFTQATKHFIGTSVYARDVYDLDCFQPTGSYKFKTKRDVEVDVVQYESYRLDNNLTIMPTKGHTMECVSLILENCDNYGSVGLVGDLFERKEDLEDESIWQLAGSQDPDLQRANRAKIFAKVDYILPGHGPLFVVDRSKGIKF